MSRAHLYRQWLNLCKTWGTDATKTGRDLGEFIRKEVGIQFKDGEMSRIADPSACEEKLKCLERIANNKYYRVTDAEWPTSTGATKEELHILTSNEGIEYAKYLYDKSTVDRLRMSLSMAFSGSDADQSRSKSKD